MRRSVLFALIFAVLIVDQWTKALARTALEAGPPQSHGALPLMVAANSGAFLSIGSNLPRRWRVTIFDGLVTLALVIALVVLAR